MSFHAMRFGVGALVGCLVLTGGAALAQEAPAAPAQGQPAAGQPQPGGPVKVDLQPTQADWTKVCGNQGPKRQICFTTRDFTPSPDQPPLVAVAVYDVKGEDPIVRILMPTGLLLRPGIRFQADKGPQQEGAYTTCFPNGCFVEAKVKASIVEAMKKATTFNVVAQNAIRAEVTFTMPLAGFGKAFDGPAIDPKVLQDQQQAQQQALQKQLEDRAKAQRQSLEKGGAAPVAPAPAPVPPKQ